MTGTLRIGRRRYVVRFWEGRIFFRVNGRLSECPCVIDHDAGTIDLPHAESMRARAHFLSAVQNHLFREFKTTDADAISWEPHWDSQAR